MRGSGAIFGAVDVLVELERCGEDAPPGHRRLVAIGRWPSTPPVLVLDYDQRTRSWRVVGQAEDRAASTELGLRARLLAALPDDEPGATQDELAGLLKVHRRKWSQLLNELVKDELARRHGEGRPHHPYRYTSVRTEVRTNDGAGSASQVRTPPVGGADATHTPHSAPPVQSAQREASP